MVIKRNGAEVPFNKEKIINAINKAFLETDGQIYELDTAQDIADEIEKIHNQKSSLTVEEIQDLVEEALMASERKDVAKEYIRYRYKREIVRNYKDDFFNEIGKKLRAEDVENSNANMDERSFGGRTGSATDVMTKKYALDFLMSPMAKQNHLNNEIYIHDLSSYAIGCHNCFDRSTKFITMNGVKSFNDFENGENIVVLGPDGNWHNATVKSYGKQRVNEYTFKKNRTEVKVLATPNHRWINSHGEFQEGLKIGDKLFESPYFWQDFDFNELSMLGKTYWCYGFILGDGTLETRYSKKNQCYYKPGTSKVKLCKEKSKYLTRFQEIGYGLNCTAKEPEVGNVPYNKTIPDFSKLPLEALIAFVHGFYDADGTHCCAASTGKPIYGIQSSNEEICNFIEQFFPVAGLYINSIIDKTGQETNFGIRGYTKSYSFTGEKSNKFTWYVKDIEEKDITDVWCLEVNDVHSFVLESGIPTGNCLTIPFDDLLAKGFNTRQIDIRPANSINTAFQLIAVIFQLQSLMQFGGVSASHLDWTMVPYVRKSFYKHFNDGIKYLYEKINIDKYDYNNSYSIEDNFYKSFPKAYKYAMDKTEKEVHQAVEAMYHNLK